LIHGFCLISCPCQPSPSSSVIDLTGVDVDIAIIDLSNITDSEDDEGEGLRTEFDAEYDSKVEIIDV